jgi:hypothetical protein
MKNKLAAIAEGMKSEAAEKGKVQRTLPKGLTMTLWRDGLDWVLSLTRYGTRASDMEMKICREAFGVPDEAEAEGEEINDYQVRRVRWVAASQEALFELPEPPARIFRD